MFLNRQNINKIHELEELANSQGLVVAQTNSRFNGSYLKSLRIYRSASDKGHPNRAIYTVYGIHGINELIVKFQHI